MKTFRVKVNDKTTVDICAEYCTMGADARLKFYTNDEMIAYFLTWMYWRVVE